MIKKEDLRPVEYKVEYPKKEWRKGWFHLWRKAVYEDGSETYTAMIESESGNIQYYEATDVKFTDREKGSGGY